MAHEEQHVALPKLVGQPAYWRPPSAIQPRPRPLDVDDLPLEAFRTADEQALFERLAENPFDASGRPNGTEAGGSTAPLRPRPFLIRALADRLFGSS
ncbi:MAG TPA: hypothetical protein VNJ28_04750 [Candidatus Limnocylindrales bacterium]|nr:hypothetical protein [Candidatus Limnocylindrales bacterium]